MPSGTVTVTDKSGQTATGSFSIGSSSLPSGVTLQAIDGETMLSPTSMSNNYYSRNGFTYAVGWDSPAFFPIACFYGLYGFSQSDFTTFLDLGLNTSVAITSNTNYSLMQPNGVVGYGGWNGSTIENTFGSYLIGMHVDEEDPSAAIASVSAANQAGRMWDLTLTWNNIVGGDIGGVPMSTVLAANHYSGPSGIKRGIDSFSIDVYWFAGSNDPAIQYVGGCIFAQPMQWNSPNATTDQMARGSHYGNMIDVYRSWANGTNADNGSGAVGKSGAASRIPLWALPENGNGWLGESTARSILPYEMNWAVWSSLIHGARGIDYFTQYSAFQATTALYNQAKATNALIKQMAPVLNSPFARGFLTSVTPHGYIFPIYEANWLNGGVEACVKWDGSNFYIIATTRESEKTTNLSATFSVASGSTATVINENRTIPIVGGKFTDTFANAWTVHIYKIS